MVWLFWFSQEFTEDEMDLLLDGLTRRARLKWSEALWDDPHFGCQEVFEKWQRVKARSAEHWLRKKYTDV